MFAFTFTNIPELRKVIEHARTAPAHRTAAHAPTDEPAVYFVHSDGVFIMSNGVTGTPAPQIYADGWTPGEHRQKRQELNDALLGDDFAELLTLNAGWVTVLPHAEAVHIYLSQECIHVESVVALCNNPDCFSHALRQNQPTLGDAVRLVTPWLRGGLSAGHIGIIGGVLGQHPKDGHASIIFNPTIFRDDHTIEVSGGPGTIATDLSQLCSTGESATVSAWRYKDESDMAGAHRREEYQITVSLWEWSPAD